MLLLTFLFAPDGVSTAHLFAELVRELRRLGHGFVVITTTPHYNVDPDARARQPLVRSRVPWVYRSSFDGTPVWHVSVRPKGRRTIGRALDYLFFHIVSIVLAWRLRDEYDVIVAPSPPLTTGVAAALLARLTRRRLVYNLQEIYPDVAMQLGVLTNPLIVRLARLLERFVYRSSDLVVTISRRFGAHLSARGVPARKLAVIENFAVDAPTALSERHNAFSRANGLDHEFVVLYAGNLGLTQDFETVIDAAVRLKPQADIRFVIVGDGARRQWLEAELRRRPLRNVTLLPYQPSSVVHEMYAASDVGLIPLQPGVASTTFPSKIYTILAHARPIIALVESNSDVADLIAAAACGWTIRPRDAAALAETVVRVRDRSADAIAMGRSGRAYLSRHNSVTIVASQYASALQAMVDG